MFETLDPSHQPPLEDGTEDSGQSAVEGLPPTLVERDGDDAWLTFARNAYSSSDTWFSSSLRPTTERALANFRSVHPPGSKYHTEQYLKKSRIFRPKTRAAIRRGEAGHAIAFFSTQDVVHCSPTNPKDPRQLLAAEVHNALINDRLTDPKQHWFKTLIGGSQDAMTVGTVISKQCWDYEEAEVEVEVEYEYEEQLEGRPIKMVDRVREKRILIDRPACRLIPLENLRIDPAADWLDPINSSPYLIEMQPTYVYEIQARIRQGKYRNIPNSILGAAVKQDWDSIRKAREGQRLDKYDNDTAINEFQNVWVNHNIIHIEGQDWVYDTLGVEVLLMDPVPIEDYYRHSSTYDRPYVMGNAIIEAHKNYPGGIPQLLEDLQEEANDIANLRIENVKHALNPRWLVRRGSGVDIRALIRNVASGVSFVSNISNDVKELRAQDVTSSSYAEQDRINLDMDDVVGTFSGSSVATNRSLNERVGSMKMLNADASRLEEFLIRTVSETWVENVMGQFVAMEAAYESDERILRVVADGLGTTIDEVMDVIDEPVLVRVNVGFNSTNPQARIEKLALGLGTVSNFSPSTVAGLDPREVVKEVFGAIGYRDGARFFPQLFNEEQDPRVVALEQQVQQLTQMLEGKILESQTKIEVETIRSETRLTEAGIKAEIEQLKLQRDAGIAQLKAQIDQLDGQIKIAETDRKRRELFLQREALSHSIQESDRQFALQLMQLNREREAMKAEGGKPKPNGAAKPNGAMNLTGNDKAGVLSREGYGMIPQAGG